MVGFSIEPMQERYKGGGVGKRPTVKLYYVGIDYDRAHKSLPPPVQIKTMLIKMPRLGEYTEIDEVYAKDLIFKTKYKDSRGVLRDSFVSEAQGGAEMARYIKTAISEGRSLDPNEIQRQTAKAQAVKYLPDEDLAEIMVQRGFEPPVELLEAIKAKASEDSSLKSILKAEDLVVDLRSQEEKEVALLSRNFAKKEKE